MKVSTSSFTPGTRVLSPEPAAGLDFIQRDTTLATEEAKTGYSKFTSILDKLSIGSEV